MRRRYHKRNMYGSVKTVSRRCEAGAEVVRRGFDYSKLIKVRTILRFASIPKICNCLYQFLTYVRCPYFLNLKKEAF